MHVTKQTPFGMITLTGYPPGSVPKDVGLRLDCGPRWAGSKSEASHSIASQSHLCSDHPWYFLCVASVLMLRIYAKSEAAFLEVVAPIAATWLATASTVRDMCKATLSLRWVPLDPVCCGAYAEILHMLQCPKDQIDTGSSNPAS